MRFVLSFGMGLSLSLLAMPAMAGTYIKTYKHDHAKQTLAGHTQVKRVQAKSPCDCQMENGVRVYRVKPATLMSAQQQALYNAHLLQQRTLADLKVKQQALRESQADQERAFERGYTKGFETANKETTRRRTKRRSRRNPYNYGRRYSTSFQSPNYRRFRSNASYGRPAYLVSYKKKK